MAFSSIQRYSRLSDSIEDFILVQITCLVFLDFWGKFSSLRYTYMLDYCGLNSVSDRPEQGSNCSSVVHPADSRPLPLLSLISPLTSPPNPFASRPSRRAGFYLPKPQKAAARQKKKRLGPNERVTAVDSISGGETSSKPQRERREDKAEFASSLRPERGHKI